MTTAHVSKKRNAFTIPMNIVILLTILVTGIGCNTDNVHMKKFDTASSNSCCSSLAHLTLTNCSGKRYYDSLEIVLDDRGDSEITKNEVTLDENMKKTTGPNENVFMKDYDNRENDNAHDIRFMKNVENVNIIGSDITKNDVTLDEQFKIIDPNENIFLNENVNIVGNDMDNQKNDIVNITDDMSNATVQNNESTITPKENVVNHDIKDIANVTLLTLLPKALDCLDTISDDVLLREHQFAKEEFLKDIQDVVTGSHGSEKDEKQDVGGDKGVVYEILREDFYEGRNATILLADASDLEDDVGKATPGAGRNDSYDGTEHGGHSSSSGIWDTLPRSFLRVLPAFDAARSPHVTSRCRLHSERYAEALRRFDLWALKMYDASAKLPSGILNGNVNQLGDFDQCLEIDSTSSEGGSLTHKEVDGSDITAADDIRIQGKYCLAYLDFKLSRPGQQMTDGKLKNLHRLIQSHFAFNSRMEDPGHRVPRFSQINWALCVPDSCTERDVELSLDRTVRDFLKQLTTRDASEEDQTDWPIRLRVKVDTGMCQTADNRRTTGDKDDDRIQVGGMFGTTGGVLACAFFAAIILTAILSTVYELMAEKPKPLLTAFSLHRNIRQLCAMNENRQSSSEISAAHGIRCLNAVMLVISHKSLALFFTPYVNRTHMVESVGKPWTVIARAASLYTDPFIMLSGLLTAHALLGRLKRGQRVNILGEYASRLVRIAPSLGALILFCTFVLPYLGSGPQWNLVVTHHSDICKRYWWRNMLFIHNYFGFENMCLTHTHHVGIDTQLFFFAVPTIVLLYRHPRRFAWILLTLAVLSTAARYYVTETRKLSNYIHFGASISQLFETANHMYILPAHRATVYIMGVLLALVLRMDEPIQLTKSQLRCGWTTATFLLLASYCLPSGMGAITYRYVSTHAACYAALAPVAWCAFYAWTVLTSHRGYRSLIGRVLSWRGFQIATRLSYSIYLTQFPVFFYNVGRARHANYYEFFSLMFNLHEFGWMLFCSVVLTLLFDTPFQNIKKSLFPTRSTTSTIATTMISTMAEQNGKYEKLL